MGPSELSKLVRRLFCLLLNLGPSVPSGATHPRPPEMGVFTPKSNTGGLTRRTTAKDSQGGQFIVTALGLSQNSGVSAVLVASDVATAGHQPVPSQQLHADQLGASIARRERPEHGRVGRRAGKWQRCGERPPLLCFASGLFVAWSDK